MERHDPSTHGELAGDIIAKAIAKAIADGVSTWRAVGNAIDLYFGRRPLEITYDPSVTPYYMDDVSVPFPPKTIALQVDKFQYVPSALWVKNDWGALAWSSVAVSQPVGSLAP